jgi:hypothetical protein
LEFLGDLYLPWDLDIPFSLFFPFYFNIPQTTKASLVDLEAFHLISYENKLSMNSSNKKLFQVISTTITRLSYKFGKEHVTYNNPLHPYLL